VLLIATGSEAGLCLEAGARLAEEGTGVRVVSMPSLELFASQEPSYRDRVLPPAVRARIVVEAGRSLGWERYAGPQGEILGVDRFGASAPGERVYEAFGFTVENVCRLAREVLTRCVA
jgi:transketolase